jgi:hypothetical protein
VSRDAAQAAFKKYHGQHWCVCVSQSCFVPCQACAAAS